MKTTQDILAERKISDGPLIEECAKIAARDLIRWCQQNTSLARDAVPPKMIVRACERSGELVAMKLRSEWLVTGKEASQ